MARGHRGRPRPRRRRRRCATRRARRAAWGSARWCRHQLRSAGPPTQPPRRRCECAKSVGTEPIRPAHPAREPSPLCGRSIHRRRRSARTADRPRSRRREAPRASVPGNVPRCRQERRRKSHFRLHVSCTARESGTAGLAREDDRDDRKAMMALFAMLTLTAMVAPIAWLVRTRIAGVRQWLAASAAGAAVSSSASLIGPWALLSVYLRPVAAIALCAALALAAYRSSRRTTGVNPPGVTRRRFALQLSVAGVFGLVVIDGLASRVAPGRTTDLDFPLDDGVYAVLQGGNSLLTNPFHHWFPSDRYALDLVKLNALGNRARGIAPARLDDYVSYDAA